MNHTIRVASQTDIDILLELMKEFYSIEHLKFNEDIIRDILREIIAHSSFGYVYLISIENQIIGYLVLTFGFSIEFHGRDALIDEFYIREDFRGKGIGTKCLSYIEQVCRQKKIKALHLEVDHTNLKAQELYHRTGYVDHNRYLLTKWL